MLEFTLDWPGVEADLIFFEEVLVLLFEGVFRLYDKVIYEREERGKWRVNLRF